MKTIGVTYHEPNNLKLQTNKKQKTSNYKHVQPALKQLATHEGWQQQNKQSPGQSETILPLLMEGEW